jgi:hypothetical protein
MAGPRAVAGVAAEAGDAVPAGRRRIDARAPSLESFKTGVDDMPSMNPLRKQKSRETPLLTPERKRKLLVVVLSLFGAALALYGGVEAVKWYKRNPPKPAADAKPVDIAKYVASDSFMKLRLSEKEAIMERMRPKEGEPMMGDPREMMKSLSRTNGTSSSNA